MSARQISDTPINESLQDDDSRCDCGQALMVVVHEAFRDVGVPFDGR